MLLGVLGGLVCLVGQGVQVGLGDRQAIGRRLLLALLLREGVLGGRQLRLGGVQRGPRVLQIEVGLPELGRDPLQGGREHGLLLLGLLLLVDGVGALIGRRGPGGRRQGRHAQRRGHQHDGDRAPPPASPGRPAGRGGRPEPARAGQDPGGGERGAHEDHTFVYFDSEKADDAAARTIAASRSQGVRRSTSVVLMKAEVKLIDVASHPWTR